MTTTVNGSNVIETDVGNFLNDASFNGATFAKLFVEDGYAYSSFLNTYSARSWTNATYNEKSTSSQTLQFTSGSSDKLVVAVSPYEFVDPSSGDVIASGYDLTEFTLTSGELVGGKSRITLKGKVKETETSSGGSNDATLTFTDLGSKTTSDDDVVYAATKAYTYTTTVAATTKTSYKGTYSYAASAGGYELSITKGAYTKEDTVTMTDRLLKGTESHTYAITNKTSGNEKLSFTGTFVYDFIFNSDPTPQVNALSYTFKTLVYESLSIKVSTAELTLQAADLSSGFDIGITPFSDTLETQSNPQLDEVYAGLKAKVYDAQFSQANTILLKTAQTINAGAGNDTITGSAGDDVIDGGLGNDSVSAGLGNDIIAWDGLNIDKVDGGGQTTQDILDLTGFGDGVGTLFDLTNRGNSTYLVSGTAASFTVTNKVTGGVLTATGIETVRISGEDVSVERFLSPNLNYVTGLDVLTAEFDFNNPSQTLPSLVGISAYSDAYAGYLIDIGDILAQDWLEEKAFNPDAASNNLSFTNANKSVVTLKTARKDNNNFEASVTLKSGDNNVSYSGGYSESFKASSTGSTFGVTTTKVSYSYKDTLGTTSTADDLVSSFSETGTQTVTLNDERSVYASKQSYSIGYYKLNLEQTFDYFADYVAGTYLATNSIKSYSFSDTDQQFSLTLNGTITDFTDLALKNVTWTEGARGVSIFSSVVNESLSQPLNLGDYFEGNKVEEVFTDLSGSLLPALLEENNIITFSKAALAFHAMDGNDKLTGSNAADQLFGDAGNDTLIGGQGNDTLNGGAGVDRFSGGLGKDVFLFAAGDTDWNTESGVLTTPKADMVLDYRKYTGDLIKYSNANLSIGGVETTATTNTASISSTNGLVTFAAGSGKTMKDAVADVAASLTAGSTSAGEIALFKVNGSGSYYLFISDDVAGVSANDVVVQLVGINTINGLVIDNNTVAFL